jgi:hypothetical protein
MSLYYDTELSFRLIKESHLKGFETSFYSLLE